MHSKNLIWKGVITWKNYLCCRLWGSKYDMMMKQWRIWRRSLTTQPSLIVCNC
jgi:hypothetical protein